MKTTGTAGARKRLLRAVSQALERAQPRRKRGLLAFAEQELILPKGPYAGRPFRAERQPYAAVFLGAMEDRRWTTIVVTGPGQAGKSLVGLVIPVLYHLFELEETVILGAPDERILADKWREDLLPMIEQTRYREYLPSRGAGSRGGDVTSIHFLHGPTLRMMSGGGSDKSRAAYTARVVCITETDGMASGASTSVETDPITQIQARMRAWPAHRRRCYMECTVSTETGRTWQEYQRGTASRLLLRCPHCRQYVLPERAELAGWQEAGSAEEAARLGHFRCPACGAAWSESDRIEANRDLKLVHRGQRIESDSQITGAAPETSVLGLRFSAVHNLFLSAGELAADEWRSAASHDQIAAERYMRQFVWAVPVASERTTSGSGRVQAIAARGQAPGRGFAPADTRWITIGVDVGRYLAHWVVLASSADARAQVIDYGRHQIPSVDLGEEAGVLTGLLDLAAGFAGGWPVLGPDGSPGAVMKASVALVDCGYMRDSVYDFARQVGVPWMASQGHGARQGRRYVEARAGQSGSSVRHMGEGWQLVQVEAARLLRVDHNADAWKTRLHSRLEIAPGRSGALTLFAAPAAEHLSFARQLAAEEMIEEFEPGRGVVQRWHVRSPQNHWLDALVLALVGASMCGASPVPHPQPAPRPPPRRGPAGPLSRLRR